MDKKSALIVATGIVFAGAIVGGCHIATFYLARQDSRFEIGTMTGLAVLDRNTGQVFVPSTSGAQMSFPMHALTQPLRDDSEP